MEPTAAIAAGMMKPANGHPPGSAAPARITMPAAVIAYPPRRCVRAHTRSLVSVHGVRMPNHQFGRARGNTFPRATKNAPISTGVSRPTGTA